jgi:urea transport system permease protein
VRDLFGGDVPAQQAAASMLQKAAFSEPDAAQLPLVEKALANASLDHRARQSLELARAAMRLASDDEALRLSAAQALGNMGDPALKPLLAARLEAEQSAGVKAALSASLSALDRSLAVTSVLSQTFTGISLGSILLLAALGLAITYGLMGVINMAHGELIMIGAYATWLVQAAFKNSLPGLFDWYLLAALPVAFIASALVGAAMERTVIRFLYGRPLETLLATWGISLVLMQGVRSLFGAQNVGVENPSWMSGSVTLVGNLTLPWNRIIIVAFAAAVLIGVTLLISKTRLGLFVRGVTQNRPIASCMGVNTARIDTYAFALGSGIAGLAGCALSQIGNVGPDLGQNYIVDSFMVVVLGGVGQLAGTVYAALGLGLLNKLLEGWAGAVLAKIAVLVFIIIFIQKRPQGIFAFKGREI